MGNQRWSRLIGQGNKDARGDEGNSASPSPITDGVHVWAFIGTGKLVCYTVGGALVWEADLQQRYGKFDIAFGMSATPVLHQNRLFVQLIHGDGKPETQEAMVVAVDALTRGTAVGYRAGYRGFARERAFRTLRQSCTTLMG